MPQMLISEIFPPLHGGSGRWFFEVYRRLEPRQYVMVVQKQGQSTDDLDENYPQKIYRCDLHVEQRIVSNRKSLRRYAEICRELHSIIVSNDVVGIHAARPLHEGLLARWLFFRYRIPYLCFVHGEDVNVAMTSRELKFITASVLKHSHRIVANSHFTVNLLRNDWKISSNKIVLMHPGIDCSLYHPSHEVAVKNSFGNRSLILLTVGRLEERKGHDAVIRSVHRLRDKYPGLVYVIAGDGGYLNPLKQMVANLNLEERVRFLGAVDDKELASLYQKCDIFVLANRAVGRDSEGFGIVLLEAQATAKPVITGSDGGTGDAMIPEVTGFRVNCQDPENPAELAQAIDLLLESPQLRSSMGQRGREFVLDKFDWSRVSKFANQVLSNPNM